MLAGGAVGAVDLLSVLTADYQRRNWDESFDERINYEINQLEQNFTLMMSFRFMVSRDQRGNEDSLQLHHGANGLWKVRSKFARSVVCRFWMHMSSGWTVNGTSH